MASCHRFITAVSLAMLACGSPPNVRKVDNSTNIYLFIGERAVDAPSAIDPHDPRVAVNEKQLAELLGHPLRFELDAAVAARFGAGLHDAYVAALESATGALTRCKASEPVAFAYGSERLETVRLTYTAVRAREEPRVPLVGPTLTLPVAPNRPDLFNGGVLCAAFESGRVATGEAAAAKTDAPGPEGTPSDPRLATLRECEEKAHEVQRTRDAGARRPLHAELLSCTRLLREALRSRPTEPILLTALGRAQSAWIAWVNEYLLELRESDRASLAPDLFRSGSPEVDGLRRGFDAPRFALPIIDAWVGRGPPTDHPDEFGTPLERCVVSVVGGRYWALRRLNPCRGYGYSELATTSEGRQRLLQRLQRWNSTLLTETAVIHTLVNEGAQTTLALLETLTRDRNLAHVALLAVARYHQWASNDAQNSAAPVAPLPLVAAAPSWWRAHPEHRAAYLYVLTQLSKENEGAVPWAKLAQFLGGRIDAGTLRAYLALEPSNVWQATLLKSAFEPGFARAPLLKEGLDAYLEAYQAGKIGKTLAGRELPARLISTVCDGGSRRDLEQLRRATRELSETYAELRSVVLYLSPVWDTPSSELCPTLERGKRQPSEPVLFGD